MDTEQIKNQYMSVSLDDIVKQDRKDKKKSRSFNKNTNNYDNSSPKSESPKLNVLESSLDDIVKSNKKPYIKKSHNNHHQQQQNQSKYHQNFKVTVKNNTNNNSRFGYQQNQYPHQYQHQHQYQQFNNGNGKGLFNRNMNMANRQNFPAQNKKFANHHNNSRLKNIPRTKITDSIDHKFFDPRGIRDYSNVKKPSTASMNNQQVETEDIDEPEYDEHGNELSFSIKVVNLPKTVIQSDIVYMFGVIGSLKDFELDTDKCEATIIFKKKSQALASIERYSGVELDGSLLILYETNNPLTKKQIDDKIAESIQSKNDQLQDQETSQQDTINGQQEGLEEEEEQDIGNQEMQE